MGKRALFIAAIAILGAALVKPTINILHHPYVPQLGGDAAWCVDTDQKVLALTFDDGPHAVLTPQILDILDRYDAKGTFFVVGLNIEEHSDIIKNLYNQGNEIGNHSWDHSRLSLRSAAFLTEQIQKTDQAIRGTGYEGHIPFRAPYGAKLVLLPSILEQMGRTNILWNVDTTKWDNPQISPGSGDPPVELSPGDIVLLHSSNQSDVVGWVERVLKEYTSQGFRFVTISELLSTQKNELPPPSQCVKDGVLGNLFQFLQEDR